MRFNVRTVGPALAAGTMMLAVAAAPAAAAAKPSVAHAAFDVHAANRALVQVRKLASHKPAAARRALARVQADAAAATHQALSLNAGGSAAAAASAFEYVAIQDNIDVQAYAKLVTDVSGSLQTQLAADLVPALAARMQALAFLGDLTSELSAKAVGTATGTVTSVMASGPGEVISLAGDVNVSADASAKVEVLLGQALATAGGTLDASISELESLLPTLQAKAQATVQAELSAMASDLVQVQTTVGATTTTAAGMLGGVVTTELGQVTSVLQGLLADLPSAGVSVGGSGSGSGTVSVGGSGSGTGSGTVSVGGSGSGSGSGTVSVGVGGSGSGTVSVGGSVGGSGTVTGGIDLPPFLATLFVQLGIALPGI